MSKFLLAQVLLMFAVGTAVAAEDKVETFALSWLPPSTSYLPFYRGPLTRTSGSGPTSDVKYLLNPKLVAESYDTVAKRFDRLRSSVLGIQKPLEPIMHKELYSEEKTLLNGAWQGVCDQWSGWTSSDKELIHLTDNLSDLACNGTFLSVPEVRELITSMYLANEPQAMDPEVKRLVTPFYDPGVSNSGQGTVLGVRYDMSIPYAASEVRDLLGTDPVPAAAFDLQMRKRISNDQGIVINISQPPQVWNHPAFRFIVNSHPLDGAQLPGSPALPAILFRDTTGKLAPLLKTYDLIESALTTYTMIWTAPRRLEKCVRS
jgi:hypothetical protein